MEQKWPATAYRALYPEGLPVEDLLKPRLWEAAMTSLPIMPMTVLSIYPAPEDNTQVTK